MFLFFLGLCKVQHLKLSYAKTAHATSPYNIPQNYNCSKWNRRQEQAGSKLPVKLLMLNMQFSLSPMQMKPRFPMVGLTAPSLELNHECHRRGQGQLVLQSGVPESANDSHNHGRANNIISTDLFLYPATHLQSTFALELRSPIQVKSKLAPNTFKALACEFQLLIGVANLPSPKH